MYIFKTLNGKTKKINLSKYKIVWNSACLSKFQKNIKDFLRHYWNGHIVFEEMPVAGTRMRFDFYNATLNIAVECDGEQHIKYNKFFHNGNKANYLKQWKRDTLKQDWCEINNIQLINIFPSDLPLTENFFKEKFGIIL